jgi:hypothetical protein
MKVGRSTAISPSLCEETPRARATAALAMASCALRLEAPSTLERHQMAARIEHGDGQGLQGELAPLGGGRGQDGIGLFEGQGRRGYLLITLRQAKGA